MTAATLRKRFAGTRLPDDPLDQQLVSAMDAVEVPQRHRILGAPSRQIL